MYKQYQQSDPFNYHIQYIHYAPYGELIENQHIGSWYDERYKFTGKERDWETGYDFFGARSYAYVLSIWLSPDPLSDKYPEISPYAYCGWNPVKYIDPDGRDVYVFLNGILIQKMINYQ
jgi:RHS repeat-associated protein